MAISITPSDVRSYKGLLARQKALNKRVDAMKSKFKIELDDNEEVMIGDYIVVKRVSYQHNLNKDMLTVLAKERHGIDIASLMDECKKQTRRETLTIN